MTDDMLRRDEEPVTFLRRKSSVKDVIPNDGAMSEMLQMTMAEPSPKKPRTSEDFKLFCKFILEYENYDAANDGAVAVESGTKVASPAFSHKEDWEQESRESQDTIITSSEEASDKAASSNSPEVKTHYSSDSSSNDNDSFDLVTCFCGKPFAGRPMIECSKCLTWIHLRCAKVKKSEIPEVFICSNCKDKK